MRLLNVSTKILTLGILSVGSLAAHAGNSKSKTTKDCSVDFSIVNSGKNDVILSDIQVSGTNGNSCDVSKIKVYSGGAEVEPSKLALIQTISAPVPQRLSYQGLKQNFLYQFRVVVCHSDMTCDTPESSRTNFIYSANCFTTYFNNATASNMYRNPSTPQISIDTEIQTANYPLGYREVPNLLNDDEGYFTPAKGCNGTGGSSQTCTKVVYATRPAKDCGLSGSISARIANCATLNSAAATWNANGSQSTSGESTWTLVTRKNGQEVWRDERTQFLWSDTIGSIPNWCQASGNHQIDDPSGICNNANYQNQITPFSACTEFTAAKSPIAGENYSTGVYSDKKGGMGARSATAVRWRLPNRNDFLQAEVDGLRFVLPNLSSFWTATVSSHDREHVWLYDALDADYIMIYGAPLLSPQSPVRCLGRAQDTCDDKNNCDNDGRNNNCNQDSWNCRNDRDDNNGHY